MANPSGDEASDVYDYGDDFLLTTCVEDAMNVVRMGFLSKVFSIIFLEFVFLTIGSSAPMIFEDQTIELEAQRWVPWVMTVLLLVFFGAMIYVSTVSPYNLACMFLSILCLSGVLVFVCGTLTSSVVSGAIELFMLQQMITYGFLTLYCVVSLAEFSFRASFALGATVGLLSLTLFDTIFVHSTLLGAVIAAVSALLVEGYVLVSLYLQCKELHPEAYDIAAVGIFTQAGPAVGFLKQYFQSDDKQKLKRRASYAYGAL